jgi:protein tyrosine phosphatase
MNHLLCVASGALSEGLEQWTRLKNWMEGTTTGARITNVTLLIPTIGLCGSLIFTGSQRNRATTSLMAAGLLATDTFLISCLYRSAVLGAAPSATSPEAICPKDLWARLEERTSLELKEVNYLTDSEVKCRFSDILCPRKTAISVGRFSLNKEEEIYYLHANEVGGGFSRRKWIASQAPLEEDYASFWEAVFQRNAVIVDLTTEEDQEGGLKYYPETLNESVDYDLFSVEWTGGGDGSECIYIVQDANGEQREIRRFHYSNWKDFEEISCFELNLLVQEVGKLASSPVIWVHDSVGVGHAGVLITAAILREKIQAGEITKQNLENSLIDLILGLRKQRGPRFIEGEGQLLFLRNYALSLIDSA